MELNRMEYREAVNSKVIPMRSKFIHMLANLSNTIRCNEEAIENYFKGRDISATRKDFYIIEGLYDAFNIAVYARLECYDPCPHLFEEINKLVYKGFNYSSKCLYNENDKQHVMEDTNLFKQLTHPESLEDLFTRMGEMFHFRVFENYNNATVILYTEAVALYRFDAIWDFRGLKIWEMKSMIAAARGGDISAIVKHCMENIVYLGK